MHPTPPATRAGRTLTALAVLATLTSCAQHTLRSSATSTGPLPSAPALSTDWTPPRPVHVVEPTYPYEMRALGVQAMVRLNCLVDARGRVAEAQAVNPQVADEFATAALEAVKRWSFAPGTRQGQPAPMWIAIPFRFNLNDAEPGAAAP